MLQLDALQVCHGALEAGRLEARRRVAQLDAQRRRRRLAVGRTRDAHQHQNVHLQRGGQHGEAHVVDVLACKCDSVSATEV